MNTCKLFALVSASAMALASNAFAAGPPSGVTMGPPASVTMGPPASVTMGPPASVTMGPPASVTMGPPASVTMGPPASVTMGPPASVTLGPPASVTMGPPASVTGRLPLAALSHIPAGISAGQTAAVANVASELGKLNAAHASPTAFDHAAPDSAVGAIATYKSEMTAALAVTDPAAQASAITAARQDLAAASNKDLTVSAVTKIDAMLGITGASPTLGASQ